MSEFEVEQEHEVDPAATPEPVGTEVAELDAEPDETGEETATSEDDAQPEKPKRRSRAEERIHELTRKNYEAQKQAEIAQRQAAELQEYIRQQQAQTPPNVGEMPKIADYDYDDNAYQQAVEAWNQQRWQGYQQQQQQLAQQQAMQVQAAQEQQMLNAKIAEGTQKYPDFAAKVNDPNLPPLREISPAAYQAVIGSDAAVDVAYYLANNPAEVYAFASMNPVQAIKTVAAIENKLAAKPQVSRMPPRPPTKLTGNSEAVKDPEKMSTDEWLAWRRGQLASR